MHSTVCRCSLGSWSGRKGIFFMSYSRMHYHGIVVEPRDVSCDAVLYCIRWCGQKSRNINDDSIHDFLIGSRDLDLYGIRRVLEHHPTTAPEGNEICHIIVGIYYQLPSNPVWSVSHIGWLYLGHVERWWTPKPGLYLIFRKGGSKCFIPATCRARKQIRRNDFLSLVQCG